MAASVAGGVTWTQPSFADNPIVQTNYTSDPAPFVDGGTMYLITTHDENVAGQPCSAVAGYTLCRWYAYSSTDMVNWTDHGTVASWSTFSWAGTAAWAPQAIPRNGKYYLYVPLNNKSGTVNIGVGVSTSPIGPYTDAIGHALVTDGCSGGTGDIDPTVFIDDDGQAYLYFGRSVPGYVKLNSDMTSYTGGVQCPTANSQTFGPAPSSGNFPTQYEEGPWIMKHGGTYFLAYAANDIPEDIAYSKATAPGGPFTYGGTIMKATGASFTNHTGIVDFNGHSYFFYHNGALQKGGSVPANGDGYHRSVCLEEFSYNADGSFPTIAPTSAGPKPLANLNPFVQTEAETIAWESGVQTEVTTDTGGGMDVTSIQNGDYIKVRSVDFGSGATSFSARVASSASGSSIELHLDSVTGTTIGTCPVTQTGGAQTWQTLSSCAVTGATGVHDLFLRFTGGSGDLFNFNWWKFDGPGASEGGTGGMGNAGGASGASSGGAASGASGSSSGGVASAVGGSNSTAGASGSNSSGMSGASGSSAAGGTSGASGSSAAGGMSASSGMSGSSIAGSGGGTSRAGNGGTPNASSGGSPFGTGGSAGGGPRPGEGGQSAAGANSGHTGGGCSCRTVSGRGVNASALLPLALAVLRRRRRSRRGLRS